MNNKTIIWLAGMLIAALLVYLTVLRIVPSQTPQDNMVAVACGSRTVFRYKNAADMFPVITKDYTASFSLATGVLGKLAGDSGNTTTSADVKNAAKSLIDTLNQDNIFFQNMLKAYFLESNNDPCNDSLRYRYTSFIQEMTNKQIQLKQFIAQVTAPQQNNTAIVINKAGDTAKVIAVVDTANGKVETASTQIAQQQSGKLVVTNNNKKLNSAVALLGRSYSLAAKIIDIPAATNAVKRIKP